MRFSVVVLVALGLLAGQARADPPLPQREREFIAIIEKARKEYAVSKSASARQSARLALQISTHQFMGLTHRADDWVGVYKVSNRADNGDRSIEIEIAPDVTLATWDNPVADNGADTLVKPSAPMANVLDGLTIGAPVVFSANIIGSLISSDDDMIRRPRLIASFSKLKKLSDDAR